MKGGNIINKLILSQSLSDMRCLNTWIPKVFENELGISLIRYEIMSQLLFNEILTQNEIQKELDIDRAAITRHLQILEEKNYIKRKKNPKDSRGVIVSLTQVGKEVMAGCDDNHEAIIQNLINGLEESQIQELRKILSILKQNVETMLRGE